MGELGNHWEVSKTLLPDGAETWQIVTDTQNISSSDSLSTAAGTTAGLRIQLTSRIIGIGVLMLHCRYCRMLCILLSIISYQSYNINSYLVGGIKPSEKNSQLGWLFPIYGNIKVCSKPPTRYYRGKHRVNPKVAVQNLDEVKPRESIDWFKGKKYRKTWENLGFPVKMFLEVNPLSETSKTDTELKLWHIMVTISQSVGHG